MPTSDQCALGPDGKLLDASEIVWVNDPDDPMPIAPIQQAGVDTTALPPKSSVTHPFFRGDPPPVVMIAGSRRSARVPQPSKRALDPDNVERPDVSKRSRPRASRQKNVVESDSDEHDEDCVGDDNRNGSTDTEPEGGIETDIDSEVADIDLESIEEAYATTKAMGDADREVPLYSCNSLSFYMTDVSYLPSRRLQIGPSPIVRQI
jgi:hypothetical protein